MLKVYLSNLAICTLSLTLNLLVLGLHPVRVIALDSGSTSNSKQAEDPAPTIEPEILAEINRVRTKPQEYALWLQEQKQYYDGIWLRLPGEKPVRTNRGLKALEEAISFLNNQQPLSPLDASDRLNADAQNKLQEFVSSNNIQNISYGRITAKGIVMSLVVDELFPDRRRRIGLLDPDAKKTGVVCKNDLRYDTVCAISYSDKTANLAEKPESTPKPEAETVTEKPETVPEKPEIAASDVPKEEDTITETLPQPRQPESLPSPPTVPQVDAPDAQPEKSEPETTQSEIVRSNVEESAAEAEKPPESTPEVIVEDIEIEASEPEATAENTPEAENNDREVESEPDNDVEIAANSDDNSRLLENVERGTLEQGDRVIAEDGSFYDSFPLEGKSGDSFTISLESDDFDPFVALIDAKGNIVEQNDDISEENSNSRIRVTIPEDGTYNVIVNAYDEGGSGKYILTVTR